MDKEKIINRLRRKGLVKDGIGITIQTIRDLALAKARIKGNVR